MVYVNNKIFNIYRKFISPFPARKCAKWQRQPAAKIFCSSSTARIFWRRLLRCPIKEFVLSEEYVTQLSQSNEKVSLYISYNCCAVEPLLIFGMSSNDAAISPESWWTYLTKTGKIYHLHITRSIRCFSFSSLVNCIATFSVRICVVFVRSHWYLYNILKSGNLFLNSLAAKFAVLKREVVLNQKTRKKQFSFQNFLAELATKSVNFLCPCTASTYPMSLKGYLRLPSLLISFFSPYAILKSLPHTVRNTNPSPFQNFWMNLNFLHHKW